MAKNIPCSGCGALRWPSRGKDPVLCRECRRSAHGRMGYQRGCRCDVCRAGKAASQREYAAMVKARDGIALTTKHRRKHGRYEYEVGGGKFVTTPERKAIYERDNWTCQLCHEPVDPSLHPNHRMAASLDHIVCQSWTLVPDHSAENLRLAHRACNSRRGDRVV